MARKDDIERLTREAAEVQAFLTLPPTEVADVLAERLGMCNVYIASTGRMLAEAKALLDSATVDAFEKFGGKVEKLGAQMESSGLSNLTADTEKGKSPHADFLREGEYADVAVCRERKARRVSTRD